MTGSKERYQNYCNNKQVIKEYILIMILNHVLLTTEKFENPYQFAD